MLPTLEALKNKSVEISTIASPHEVIVDARGSSIVDEDLRYVADEPDVTWISLFECPITNQGAKYLSANCRLEYLDVGLTNVDGTILRWVRELPRLLGLGLCGVRDIEDNIFNVFGHSSLDSIDVSRTNVTSESIRQLILSTHLTSICIEGTAVDINGLLDLDDSEAAPFRHVIIRCANGVLHSLLRPSKSTN